MSGRRGLGWGPRAARWAVAALALPGSLAVSSATSQAAPRAAAAVQPVTLLELEGAIGPVTVRRLGLALDRAEAAGAGALVVRLDTPGGLERSMRASVQRILNARVPVIVWVGPTGARAASAGLFLVLAGHVAAMAPATNLGAAHPVAIGGGGDRDALKKIASDAAAFVRTLAAERGRNVAWAERAVRESVSATEREALRLGVVDVVAASVLELLALVDGRTVRTAGGPITLATRGAEVRTAELALRDRVLAALADPNVAYVLMVLGMLGLLFELSHPGAILPGVVGGIALLLAFFAFQSLPISYAGLLLLLLGVVLLVAEIKVVSHGVLAVGGLVALTLGSLMLFDTPRVEGLRVSWWVIAPSVGAVAALVLVVVAAGARALARRPTTGASGLLGRVGVASEPLAPGGQVKLDGEIWQAVAEGERVEAGAAVRVIGVEGLTLKVVGAPPREVAELTSQGGAP